MRKLDLSHYLVAFTLIRLGDGAILSTMFKAFYASNWTPFKVVTSLSSIMECASTCLANQQCTGFGFNTTTDSCNLGSQAMYYVNNKTKALSYAPDALISNTMPASKVLVVYANTVMWGYMPSVQGLPGNTNCSSIPNFPKAVYKPAAMVINGKVYICGGLNTLPACYNLDPDTNKWVQLTNDMSQSIRYTANAMTKLGWWITGGLDSAGNQGVNNTSLYDITAGTWSAGPYLAVPTHKHCVAALNASMTFVAGGQYIASPSGNPNIIRQDAWLYNWETSAWTQLPDMPSANMKLACTYFQYSNGTQVILAIGGGSATQTFAFNLKTWTWYAIPALPSFLQGGAFLWDGLDLLFANVEGGTFLKFDQTNSKFTQVGTSPNSGQDAVIVQVGDEQLSNCV